MTKTFYPVSGKKTLPLLLRATTTFSISGLPNLPLPGKPEAQLNDTTAVDLYGIPRPTDGTRPDIGASNYTQPSQDDAL